MRGDPLDDMVRLDEAGGRARNLGLGVHEGLDVVVVEVVSARLPVPLAPFEVLVEHIGDGQSTSGDIGRRLDRWRIGHELVESLIDRVRHNPLAGTLVWLGIVWTKVEKVVSLAVQDCVPAAALGPVPGRWLTSHEWNPPA
jgi:hypothetical protein